MTAADETLDRTELKSIELESDATFQCPFPIYDRFRETAPVYFYERGGFYFVTRMAEVKEALANPSIYSSELRNLLGIGPELNKVALPSDALLFSDPPRHGRTRNMINQAFSLPRVNAMEGRLQAILDGLFDGFIEKGRFEAHMELAMPLPIDFIAQQFDFPIDNPEKRKQFWHWSEAIAATFNWIVSSAEREKLVPTFLDLNAFLLAKRKEKIASPTKDIVSVIAAGNPRTGKMPEDNSIGEERLSDDEYLAVSHHLIVGGNENTTSAALSALHRLASSPELFQRLRRDRALIRNFIEEILRLETPATGFIRLATQDTNLGGVAIPKGSIVHLRFAAANRDPAQFPCPETLDLERRQSASHVAFGAGPHACVGQMLARRELTCLVNTLCDRIETLEVDPTNDGRYRHTFWNRALNRLHLQFTKSA